MNGWLCVAMRCANHLGTARCASVASFRFARFAREAAAALSGIAARRVSRSVGRADDLALERFL
jgi:hypothetical protein